MTENLSRHPDESEEAGPASLAKAFAGQVLAALESRVGSLDGIQEQIDRITRPFAESIEAMVLSFSRVAPSLQRASLFDETNALLAPHGWFLSLSVDSGVCESVRELLAKGNPSAAVTALVEECEGGLAEQIIDRACSSWAMGSRSRILRDALFAYERGLHTLCVPVLLSQAEGAYVEWLAAVAAEYGKLFDRKQVKTLEEVRGYLTISETLLYVCLGAFSKAIPGQLTASSSSWRWSQLTGRDTLSAFSPAPLSSME